MSLSGQAELDPDKPEVKGFIDVASSLQTCSTASWQLPRACIFACQCRAPIHLCSHIAVSHAVTAVTGRRQVHRVQTITAFLEDYMGRMIQTASARAARSDGSDPMLPLVRFCNLHPHIIYPHSQLDAAPHVHVMYVVHLQ